MVRFPSGDPDKTWLAIKLNLNLNLTPGWQFDNLRFKYFDLVGNLIKSNFKFKYSHLVGDVRLLLLSACVLHLCQPEYFDILRCC